MTDPVFLYFVMLISFCFLLCFPHMLHNDWVFVRLHICLRTSAGFTTCNTQPVSQILMLVADSLLLLLLLYSISPILFRLTTFIPWFYCFVRVVAVVVFILFQSAASPQSPLPFPRLRFLCFFVVDSSFNRLHCDFRRFPLFCLGAS